MAMLVAIAAIFGLAVGSFLNVIIHRVPLKLSFVRPPSSCTACGTPIRPRDNVPVLSYVVLRGRCRACGVRISVRYPVVETMTAAAFAGAAARFRRPAEAVFVAVACAVLVALAFIDLQHRRVPNVIVLPATAVALVWVVAMSAAMQRRDALVSAVGSGAVGFGILFVIAVVSGGMGFGDVKLAGFIGVATGWFGWSVFALALFGGFFAGGLVAIVLLAAGRRSRKDAIPFAPMLCFGAMLALFVGGGPVRAWLGV
jgi:leader peptidase (prepilin peptidase)/N-methyltransferase